MFNLVASTWRFTLWCLYMSYSSVMERSAESCDCMNIISAVTAVGNDIRKDKSGILYITS